MGKCETKAIQTDSGTFRHNKAYSKICVNLACSEPWYIESPDIFKTRNICRTLVYSEPRYTENSGIFKNQGLFRHLRWSVLWKQLTENGSAIYKIAAFSTSWNKYREVVIRCKKNLLRARVPRTVKLWYTYWYIQIN